MEPIRGKKSGYCFRHLHLCMLIPSCHLYEYEQKTDLEKETKSLNFVVANSCKQFNFAVMN